MSTVLPSRPLVSAPDVDGDGPRPRAGLPRGVVLGLACLAAAGLGEVLVVSGLPPGRQRPPAPQPAVTTFAIEQGRALAYLRSLR